MGYNTTTFFYWFPPLWDTTEEVFLHCGIQRKRFSFVEGYNRRCFYPLLDLTRNNLRRFNKFLSVVSHNSGVFLHTAKEPLYPTQYCKRIFSVVSLNAEDSVPLWDTTDKNDTTQNDIFKI